jgi:hypothetical protein
VFGAFGLLELCRLNLFKFHIKVLKQKESPIHPPLGPWILTDELTAAEVAEQGDGGRAREQRQKMEKLSSVRSRAKI